MIRARWLWKMKQSKYYENFNIQTDHVIPHQHPDLVLMHKKEENAI